MKFPNPLNIFKNNDALDAINNAPKYGDISLVENNIFSQSWSSVAPVYSFAYDGSGKDCIVKPIINYVPDYTALAMRSMQAYYESDICQMVINNDIRWVIGAGLTLKSIPNTKVLKQFNIDLKADEFAELSENFFKVIKKSKKSTYSENCNLDETFSAARLSKLIQGDVLYIYRVEDGALTCQTIEGINVWAHKTEHNGNKIVHGVEIDDKGKHVAYWVRQVNKNDATRLPAYIDDVQVVYMGYASKYRIDDVRGMPLLSAMLQTVDAITGYRNATLKAAQERENIAYVIEHGTGSTGEDPIKPGLAAVAAKMNLPSPETVTPGFGGYAIPSVFANNIAATTDKTVINLPIDSQMKVLDSKNNLYFKEFFRENFGVLCAAVGQPPEVVLQKFEGSFSSSRMGGEMWNHNKNILIAQEVVSSYRPFVNLSNELFARSGIFKIPAYLKALDTHWITREAANRNEFVGVPVPHIDPVKEIKAERLALGEAQANIPLTTLEDSAERLNLGDLTANLAKATKDFQEFAPIFGFSAGDPDETTEPKKD